MSFFDSFIAGAATAGVGIIDQQQKAAEEERMLKLRAEIEEKKQEALEKMREDRARERDLRAGKEIEEKANLIGTQAQPGRDQIQASSNAEVGKLSEQDKIELANATPEQRADLGIINGRTRAQIADDKATAATDLGYFNHANTYRQQQQLELGRAREERMEKSDEQKTDTANRHWALQYEHQEKQTAETIRHNKELERRAAEKSAAEKLSPAAKAALELASNGLSASQIELKQAAAEKSRIATKDYMDPGQKSIDIADADKRYAAAQKEYLGSRKFYNATMSTYLDGYKPVEVGTEAAVKDEKTYPAPTTASIEKLMKNPDKKADFDNLFGPGASSQYLKEAAKPTQTTKPTATTETPKSVDQTKPSYQKWMDAKKRKDDVLAAAEKMSPDRRSSYLESRLPQIEMEIGFNENYNRY